MKTRIPILTLCVVLGAMLASLVPPLARLGAYDRSAVLAGELWRLLTCHWVHLSPTHLAYDAAAFGIAGWIIESRGYQGFGLLCAATAVTVGLTLLVLVPELSLCGGLSGLATAAVVYLALQGVGEKGLWRWVCLAALVATFTKMVAEVVTGKFFFVAAGDAPFAPVPASHVAGGLTAVVIFVLVRIYAARRIPKAMSIRSENLLVCGRCRG